MRMSFAGCMARTFVNSTATALRLWQGFLELNSESFDLCGSSLLQKHCGPDEPDRPSIRSLRLDTHYDLALISQMDDANLSTG